MHNKTISLMLLIVILCPTPALAKDKKGPERAPRPALFQQLIDCKSLTDSAARLACYDQKVSQIDQAEAASQIVVVDQEQVKKARKTLFGLSLPSFDLFGGNEDTPEFQGIETTIKSAYQYNYGKWAIILEDGAKWVQTDTGSIRDPKAGQPIKIRKAAMGSFFANVNNQRAIRMRREN